MQYFFYIYNICYSIRNIVSMTFTRIYSSCSVFTYTFNLFGGTTNLILVIFHTNFRLIMFYKWCLFHEFSFRFFFRSGFWILIDEGPGTCSFICFWFIYGWNLSMQFTNLIRFSLVVRNKTKIMSMMMVVMMFHKSE